MEKSKEILCLFKKVYNPVYHNGYFFNLRVIGVRLSEELWKEGFCYQEIILEGKVYRFLFKELTYRPLFFNREKVRNYIEDLFSFVPADKRVFQHEDLKIFSKPVCRWLGFALFEKQKEDGVFFITQKGDTFFFPREKGKPLAAPLAFTLMHPLPPYACFL